MADGGSGNRTFWSDTEIVVDKDGVPHYTGLMPHLMKEYRRRVLFAFNSLEGDGDTEAKELADLEKKKKRFALKLINGLHGEAWRAVESLTLDADRLKKADGYKEIFAALQGIEKEGIIKKTEAFDKFFEQTTRRKGEPIDLYLRKKIQAWEDLKDLDEASAMSEDLLSYFILKGCALSRDDRRQILLANKNAYVRAGIEQALRISFHDMHEREKDRGWKPEARKGQGRFATRRSYAVHDSDENYDDGDDAYYQEDQGDDYENLEDEEAYIAGENDLIEEASDAGASNDDEVFDAYAAMSKVKQSYQDARKKLRDIQRSRGFFKSDGGGDRQKQIEQEKKHSRCTACHRVGHWAGDSVCPRSGKSGPQRGSKGKSKGRGRSSSGKGGSRRAAYMTSTEPLFFNLDDDEDQGKVANYAFMIHGENDGNASEEMEMDAGKTWYDDRRKVRSPSQRTNSEWEFCSDVGNNVPTPLVPSDVTRADVMQILRENNALGSVAMGSGGPNNSYAGSMAGNLVDQQSRLVAETQKVIQPVINANVEIREVVSMTAVRPNNLREMKAYELQTVCRDWNIQTSGRKGELLDRLERLFSGQEVAKKSCSMKFIKLVEEDGPSPVQGPVLTAPQATNFPSPDRGPQSYPQRADPAHRRRAAAQIVDQLLPPSKEITVKDLVAGAELLSMPCWKCSAPMVARQNRHSGEWFFSCSKFPTTRCDVTHALFTGLEILNGRLEATRFPAGRRP